jgi:hypothetical protein
MFWIPKLGVAVVFACCVGIAQGQQVAWIGSSGTWGDAANWQGGNVPNTNSETPVLGGTQAYVVTMSSSYPVAGLRITSPLATLRMVPGTELALATGTIENNGTIEVNPTGAQAQTFVRLSATGTIDGAGTIVLRAHPSNLITSELFHPSGQVTTIGADQLIRGTGQLRIGTFQNLGTIRADLAGETLQANSCTLSGPGRFEATDQGVLAFFGATLTGVRLSGTNGGVFRVTGNSAASSLRLDGLLEVNPSTFLNVSDGQLVNNGQVLVNPTGSIAQSYLQLAASGTISGTGDVVLNGNDASLLSAELFHPGTQTTVLGPGQTLRGAGRVRLGTFVFEGAIAPGWDADQTRTIRAEANVELRSSAVVRVDIEGSAEAQFDRISGTGARVLRGSLEVSFLGGYRPTSACEEFAIINGTNVTGSFDSVVFPAGSGGQIRYESNRVVIFFLGEPCDSIDFNNDGSFFDPQDIEAFLSVYSEGPCVPAAAMCNDVNFFNDCSLFDPCDIASFLLMYSEGPCTSCGG